MALAQEEFKKVYLKEGDVLFYEGDISSTLYIVERGCLKIMKKSGKDMKEIAEIGPNQIVGELAFIDESPRSATAIAFTNTSVIELDTKRFRHYLKSQPEWLIILIEALIMRLRSTSAKLI